MTAEEFLTDKNLNDSVLSYGPPTGTSSDWIYISDVMRDFAESYHQAKLKEGEVCIKCKKEKANRGLGIHKLVCSDCWNSLCD